MSALLDHEWGVSPAQDRVWSQVSGLRPDSAARRLLMALNFQAFMDESVSQTDLVLAGHVATAESWAKFSKDWADMLPYSVRADDGGWHFKMSEMAQSDERMSRVPAFSKIIEEHVLFSVSCRINLQEFERAHKRVASILLESMRLIIDFKVWNNPYHFCFKTLIDGVHTNRHNIVSRIPLDEKIDFIFDDRSEKAAIISAWDENVSLADDNIRGFFGATPRFEDDREFLPLQAADFWAWWVREWYEWEESPLPEAMANFDFGKWKGKKRPQIAISANEDIMVERLKQYAIEAVAFNDPDDIKHMHIVR